MPAWPASLPKPLLSGYQLQPLDTAIRTDMDAGKKRTRNRYTRTPTAVPCAWVFSDLQMAIFEAWYAQQIANGAAAFTLTLKNGYAAQTVTAKFSGPYTAAPDGRRWHVSATLDVDAFTQMSSAALAPYL
jgi:hypothetical protein